MNQQVLESLLMDRALHSLSPDTDQLLEVYLTEHPEFRHLADTIQQTACLGQSAVTAEMPTDIPPFPRERLRYQYSQGKSIGRWVSLAACILMGIGIGFCLSQSRRFTISPDTAVRMAQAHTESEPLSSGLETAQAFWSPKSYYDRYEKRLMHLQQSEAYLEHEDRVRKYRKRGLL